MKVLKGISAASGIVEGIICVYDAASSGSVPHYTIEQKQVAREIKRLDEALAIAKDDMDKTIELARVQFDDKAAEIFKTHLLMFNDRGLYEKITSLIKDKMINAEHAVGDVFEEYFIKYEKSGGHFKELTHDLEDTRNRIISAFGHETGKFRCAIGEQKPVIVAANQLTPSMVLNIPKEHALAFVTREGGFTSHATILARSFGVPIVFGIDIAKELDCCMHAIVDGSKGEVVIDPDSAKVNYYKKKIENLKNKKLVCNTKTSQLHAKERKIREIKLKVNLSMPEELDLMQDFIHEGVGLLRTEFLFMTKDEPPGEDEQYRTYNNILSGVKAPVTVRVLDLSNDKLPPFLKMSKDYNPDMGFRGAMAVELYRDIYLSQFKALLRANTSGNLQLLYPMVADLSDLKTFREMLDEAIESLKKERIEFNYKNIKEGIMVETPAAVMMIDDLIKKVDFVNIGSNDLFQYTLAAARGNSLTEKRYHILHPALLKMIEIVAKAGKRAKKEVCLCGELAAFEEFYPILFGAGLRSFSVAVSKFIDIQCEIYHQGSKDANKALREYYSIKSKEDADEFFSKYI